ncbi:MAG: peptidoglycan DD-metalloendopeptidase family protein [bacterium]
MRDKQIKLIYYSLLGSESKEFILSRRRIFSLFFSALVMITIFAGSSIALFTDFFHNIRIDKLENINKNLRSQLDQMASKVDQLDDDLRYLEKENDDMRIFADMPVIDNDIREVGIGGFLDNDEAITKNNLTPEIGNQLFAVKSLLDKIERRLDLYEANRREIENALAAREEQFKHTPSIRPVQEGRISEKYGPRVDPFTDVSKHHYGLDIAAMTGAKVYAPAAGTVVVAKNRYKVGKGYGREVIIDHGNGLRTRYAHLSDITVTYGQRIKRWEIIGLVGQTGRATGPHLHYEVMVNGRPINPDRYILD